MAVGIDEMENAREACKSFALENERLRAENERLLAGFRDVLNLLADGPGGPRRLSAIKFIEGLLETKPVPSERAA